MNTPTPEPLAILLIVENSAGDDMYVLQGTVSNEKGSEVWREAEGKRWIPLATTWREEKRVVVPEIADIFGSASYFLPIVVHELPDGEAADSIPLGWKVPE